MTMMTMVVPHRTSELHKPPKETSTNQQSRDVDMHGVQYVATSMGAGPLWEYRALSSVLLMSRTETKCFDCLCLLLFII